MTDPLTPANGDLRDFPHTPIFRTKLFASEFHARASDAEWRAGVTLWLKAWDQVPAGSLPVDDVALARLAELGRDVKSWNKLKAGALRGWIICSDGRMYHPIVAEGVNNALNAKVAQREKTANARIAALTKKMQASTDDAEKARYANEIQKVQQGLSQTLSLTAKTAIKKSVTDPVTDPVTESKRSKREGEGKENVKEKGFDLDKPPLPPKGGGRVKTPVEDPEGFAAFYAEYRRKDARADAVKAWRALSPDPALQGRIMAAVRAWRWAEDRTKIPLPASWIRGARWEDQSLAVASAQTSSKPDWVIAAGFSCIEEAANFRCNAGNYREFADGQRITAGAGA
ncbi:MAG: hypothetical protein V4451_17010 [Pseudomonadota bacterium]